MYPFTSSQWKELEQQALIFKYLASGLPIPSDLIMPIKKSFLMDLSIGPSVASPGFGFLPLHTPNGYGSPEGWGCFQTGFGRRVEDPEPGRCRRTDGKKWRCSRESYGDSKYCERHMHRGKNRSRKLVELSLATTNTNSSYSSSSGTHNLHSSPYSPYSSFRTQSNGTGIGLSLGDDNHRYSRFTVDSYNCQQKQSCNYKPDKPKKPRRTETNIELVPVNSSSVQMGGQCSEERTGRRKVVHRSIWNKRIWKWLNNRFDNGSGKIKPIGTRF